LVAIAGKLPAAKKKQVQGARGNTAEQTVTIDKPYCDVYSPYTYKYAQSSGKGAVNQIDVGDLTDTQHRDADKINNFLNMGLSTSDPIGKDYSFSDPGYPILGNPANHFYSDGSDLTRLLVRLAYTGDTDASTKPVCPRPTGGGATASAEPGDESLQYFLVHVVHWEKSKGTYSYKADQSEWYVFNRSDDKTAIRQFPFRFRPVVSSDLRMYGGKVLLLAVHLAPIKTMDPHGADCSSVPSSDYCKFKEAVAMSYKLKVQKVEPANVQDLTALLPVLGVPSKALPPGAVGAEAPPPPPPPGATPANKNLKDYQQLMGTAQYVGIYGMARLTGLENLPVQITASMDAKVPAADTADSNVNEYQYACAASGGGSQSQCFWDALAAKGTQVTPAQGGGAPATGTAQGGGGSATNAKNGKPTTTNNGASSPAASCTTQKNGGDCTESATIQDQKLYWWDVSVGVPIKGPSQVQFLNGSVTPKTVSKHTAYGLLMLAPFKEDIVTPPSLGIPHLLMGVPFSGKVLDTPFVGLGETINLTKIPGLGPQVNKLISNLSARFYAGLGENKQFSPAATAGGPLQIKWVGKLQYGIEISVKDAQSKLSGSSSASSSSKGSKNN
jgi:hypothetical protein